LRGGACSSLFNRFRARPRSVVNCLRRRPPSPPPPPPPPPSCPAPAIRELLITLYWLGRISPPTSWFVAPPSGHKFACSSRSVLLFSPQVHWLSQLFCTLPFRQFRHTPRFIFSLPRLFSLARAAPYLPTSLLQPVWHARLPDSSGREVFHLCTWAQRVFPLFACLQLYQDHGTTALDAVS